MARNRIIWIVFAVLVGFVFVSSRSQIELANVRDRETAETILNLRAQTIGRHVNAWNPVYDASFQVYSGARYGRLVVVLYDLAGREPGRHAGSEAIIPLNTFAARLTPAKMLRPRLGETPLEPFKERPVELASETRPGNLAFATNAIGSSWISETTLADGRTWLVATTPVNDWDDGAKVSFISAWLQVALPLDEVMAASRERTVRFYVFWLIAGAMTAAGCVWSMRGRRALRAAAEAAEKIEIARLTSSRLPEPADDPEGARLVRACNRLLDRVAEIHGGQQRFVADAAHELRTPLTILRGEIQVALREPANHPLLLDTLRSNLDESVHLSRLVDSLLTLARADAGNVLGERAPLDLSVPVQAVLDRMRPFAEERRVKLGFNAIGGPGDLRVSADAVAIERVVFNLVDNAVKHSPADQSVEVVVSGDSSTVRLEVVDHGIGIGPEHLPRIFDRFYRVDAARRRTDGGSGLGLAIVKTIVEAHGGKVAVASEIGVGSRFSVSFPAVRVATPDQP